MLVKLPDGLLTIRWDLDHFTYKQIKEVVTKKYFDSLANDYSYNMRPYISSYQDRAYSTPVFYGAVRCIQGKRAKNVEFKCSELFAGNMEWFRNNVHYLKDIDHLKWGNFV